MSEEVNGVYKIVDMDEIETNPYQPRTVFNDASIEEMAASIEQHGIIQPIVVREQNGKYEIIAGERRYRGARKAGLKHVPVIVREVGDGEMLQLALIENIQREDISAVDKARGMKRLMDEFGFNQRQVGELLGMSRPTIANTLRLLDLPDEIVEALHKKLIAEGHARTLSYIKSESLRNAILKRVVEKRISVRETERLIKAVGSIEAKVIKEELNADEQVVVDRFRDHFGTKVDIEKGGFGGAIRIEYYDDEDLKRICDLI